jgi:hypothetical protein
VQMRIWGAVVEFISIMAVRGWWGGEVYGSWEGRNGCEG